MHRYAELNEGTSDCFCFYNLQNGSHKDKRKLSNFGLIGHVQKAFSSASTVVMDAKRLQEVISTPKNEMQNITGLWIYCECRRKYEALHHIDGQWFGTTCSSMIMRRPHGRSKQKFAAFTTSVHGISKHTCIVLFLWKIVSWYPF